ncbi:MAG TPA: threonine--tRNA ligase [Longimicrobiaceae bacterium]|nr:threonine--tRNA ligase [Longimicrobiaceae bacterium]
MAQQTLEMDGPAAGAEADRLYKIRHSLAHVMAQAVLEMRPGSELGFGPPIDDGFYYDFVLTEPVSEEDFPEIEQRMKRILKQNQKFESEVLPRQQALELLRGMGQQYKSEYAEDLLDKQGFDELSFYRNGPFLDLCRGPHVASTREIPLGAFKLRSVAGAYWRGDSSNVMMTRLYAWAFESKEELEAHVRRYREALGRDHKKLGRELDIFVIDEEIGKGLPLWLPNGTVLRDELEKLARELEFKHGYQRVATPHLAKVDLYYQTGHLPYYAESMYPFMELREEREGEGGAAEVVKETYALKPMNCPHHHRIYAARPRSYRDLPLRLAEYGTVYRYEDSGALSGLLRVRGMTMNDAHIYCTEEQIRAEFLSVMELHREIYDLLGLSDYYMRLSTWDPDDPKGKQKYVDNPEAWERSQELVRQAMRESGLPFTEAPGEAAFYGPKIDVQFRSVTGREETFSTNQLDFAVPPRLGLVYTGADNREHHPYVIHRAPLGTHERFVALLIEHFGGAFPTWLAPVQVRVITVADRFDDHARRLVQALRDDFVRAELDPASETVGKKIREAVTHKVPNILVIGEREEQDGTVTLRRYGSSEQQTLPFPEFHQRLLAAIRTRSREL